MPNGPFVDSRNVNALWASVLVETLARCGVRRAVISPGSRSTPLTLALVAHPQIETIPVLDERSAAFFALGLAKPSLRPVVLVCTSGTAGANYLPAVIEAHESAVPLLVLTADRPSEMRACASGQTIDQQKLFGVYPNFYHELAVPEASVSLLRYLRQTVAHAVARSLAPSPGPVHLNAPFRDPLPPLPDDGVTEKFAATIDWNAFFRSTGSLPVLFADAAHKSAENSALPLPFSPAARGVIIAGPQQPADVDAFVAAVGEIARRLGWPVLADGLSPVRNHGSRIPNLVTAYDIVLRNRAAADRLKPEAVLAVGGWPTSKVLRAWIEDTDPPIWLVTERADNRDALHGRTQQIVTTLSSLSAQWPAAQEENEYQRAWEHHECKARAVLDERIRAEPALFEPKAAWLLAQHLPPGTPLVIGNSMPIRDVEYVWPANDRGIRPLCNRGANGIDGTLSTALGVAHDSGRPTVLLTGDLALLHDTNGFLLREKFRGSLTIVLINNAGGGIFEHLPVAQFEPPFEEFFATPQPVDFAQLCPAYGVPHVPVRDWTHFTELISSLPASGIRVLELRTDRKHDATARKQLFADIAASM